MPIATFSPLLAEALSEKLKNWQNQFSAQWQPGLIQSEFLEALLLELPEPIEPDSRAALPEFRHPSEFSDLGPAKKYLRVHRKAFMLHLLSEVLLNELSEQECLKCLSDFADQCITFAARVSQQILEKRFGQHPNFLVLALGKLGGRELNFSSDIDLIFTYLDPKESVNDATIAPQDFYKRVAKLFIQLLDEVNEDGRVFRVDMRLRPFGESGPLVLNFKSFETYYQEHGRGWERYALQKMRVVNGSSQEKDKINGVIQPFVYRRYLDYGVFEVLRSLRSLINQEIKQKSLKDDVKRGLGGIREIEFICQSLQLIHGGKKPTLRVCSLLESIEQLEAANLLKSFEASFLQSAYLYLRKLENRLQMYKDKQTHALPSKEEEKLRLCYAMGHTSLQAFDKELSELRKKVHNFFLSMLNDANDSHRDENTGPYQELTALWQQHLTEDAALDLLKSLGFRESKKVLEALSMIATSNRLVRLSQAARSRLDHFIPLLFVELSTLDEPSNAFFRVINLIDAILGRSSYFALLSENKQALQRVLILFSKSEWLGALVSEKPYLLGTLLENPDSWNAETIFQDTRDIQHLLQEEAMDSLRAYKYECTLKIACLEIEQKITSFIAGKLLSKLAELCLNKAISWLMSKMPEVLIREHFMVVAYGRFAGEEMSYESDLDLIFLYREGCSQHDLFVRFVKKLIKFLSLSTSNGFLYQVDPRLRPSGSSGLLVSDLEQFREYQCEKAWTWEHQALIRSRVVFGNSSLESDFLEIRAKALSKPRELSALKSDICQMREKIKEHKGAGSQGIKLIEGGLVDLEFLLQFLILKAAHHLPGVLDCVGVLSQIVRLQAETAEEYQELADLQRCFLEFKKAEQSLLLGLSDTIERATAQQRVRELWHQFLN